MFFHVMRREVLNVNRLKYKVPSVNCLLIVHRHKSEFTPTKLPETVQILKPVGNSSSAALRIKTINKAMKAYLERSRQYQDFLKVKNDEFEIGRQHLANIMGLEAGNLTQDDIDKAIEYLLPSGLYEKKARPMMKPPSKMYPKEKAAQFDNNGRPFSCFFYTRKSNYHSALHILAGKFYELDAYEDGMIAKGILTSPKNSALNLSAGEWITIDEMNNIFLEQITETEYMFFINTLTRLGNHPYSLQAKDEISKYRKEFVDMGSLETIPELLYDENGRPYMEQRGYRKICEVNVIVRGNGTGKVKIHDTDIFYFENLHDREQVMYPLYFTDLLGKVDIEAEVICGEGFKAQAGAIRYGVALCLRSFVEPDMCDNMRLAGLLTRDRRGKGRKKPGQKGCRAKYTWKKR